MKQLSEKLVQKQNYPERVLQFGEGNFMRAFVDWQIDKLNKAGFFNGSVVIVQPIEHGLTDRLNQQDNLYTLILEGVKNGEPVREKQVIDSISRSINPYVDKAQYLALAKQPDLKFIFSNTTEAGIAFDPQDQLSDRLAKTFPGKLTAFLYQRYLHFNGDDTKGMYIIPCELIDRNADKLKACVLQYIQLWQLEEAFKEWIETANQFYCSLVDRIVPGYPGDQANIIEKELGYRDQLLIVAEHYHLWVIEADRHLQERLPVDQIGLNTLFVSDLNPYRTRKVHILNGTHTAMTPVAYLLGLETVEQAICDPRVERYLKLLISQEVTPTLPIERSELEAYTESVLERFKNPYINHQLMSISLNGIAKFATRNLPVLKQYIKQKQRLPKKLVFAFTSLIYFYRGRRAEEKITIKDDQAILACFRELWNNFDGSEEAASVLVSQVLQQEKWWGEDLTQMNGLTEMMAEMLIDIDQNGLEAALVSVIGADTNA